MAPKKQMVPLEGSHRNAAPKAKDIGPVDKEKLAEVTVRLRSRTPETQIDQQLEELTTMPISERKYLTRDELTDLRGANPEDLAKIDAFAHNHNLTVVESSIPKRLVRLQGTLNDLQRAFGVKLRRYRANNIVFRGRTGEVFVPNGDFRHCRRCFWIGHSPGSKAALSSSQPGVRESGRHIEESR